MSENHDIIHPVITDTALWHLAVYLTDDRIDAYLKNIHELSAPLQKVMEVPFRDKDQLLKQIENAVYDNPYILDDFSSDIIISTDNFTLAPVEMTEASETVAEKLYTSVFPSSAPDDIFYDSNERVCVMFSPVAGLKDFLSRTFPGARISSEVMVLIQKFAKFSGGGNRVYLHYEMENIYVFAFTGKNVVFAARYDCKAEADALYYAMNTMEVIGFDSDNTEILVSGEKEFRKRLFPLLRKYFNIVMQTMLPKSVEDEAAPLSLSLRMSRFNRNEDY